MSAAGAERKKSPAQQAWDKGIAGRNSNSEKISKEVIHNVQVDVGLVYVVIQDV
jgi:hypothetical protein